MIRTALADWLGIPALRRRLADAELALERLQADCARWERACAQLGTRVQVAERDLEELDECLQALSGGEVVYVHPSSEVKA